MSFDHGWDLQWFKDRVEGREPTFRFVAELCGKAGCGTVLDIGGGIGSLRVYLPAHIQHTVVDLSPKAKQIGEVAYPQVTFITGRVSDVIGPYDAVVALSLIEHLDGYEQFLKFVWEKTRRLALISFRNGLGGHERSQFQSGRYRDYWDNHYNFSVMEKWINKELHPSHIGVKEIEVKRTYSPELVLVLVKEGAHA